MRLKLVISFVVLVWVILLIRVYHISINSHKHYKDIAKSHTIHSKFTPPVRGIIKDRNGKHLAVNKLGFAIFIKPKLKYKSKQAILNKEISLITKNFANLNKEKIHKRYIKGDSAYNHDFVKVVEFIPYDDMLKVYPKFLSHANIQIRAATKRFYPYKDIASHIIGYVGKANQKDIKTTPISRYTGFVGKSGIERYYDTFLQNSLGKEDIRVNAYNEELAKLSSTDPIKSDIQISIDINLEKYISSLFEKDKKSGAAIVLDIKSGEILAAGSFPEYDLNTFVDGISQKKWNILKNDFNHPFTNKIVNGLYPPGSTIKMGVGISFLANKTVSKHSITDCNGSITLGKRKFRCWAHWGHKHTNLKKAIRESCDVYFYQNSLKLGIEKISNTLEKFGFGQKTGVDLPNEFIGILPNKEWKMNKYAKPWYRGETVISSIGQGYFLATPLQVAKYTATLASGKIRTPHLIQNIGKETQNVINEQTLDKKDKKFLQDIQEGMYDVSNNKRGTAFKYLNTPYPIAAKTGTSQVVGIPQSEQKRMKEEELEYYHRSHAWLTSYGPYKKPKYVVTVLIEHGGHGGSAAGGIVSDIYNYLDKNLTK